MQSHRISTNIGQDQLVTVELKQDYDLLEILSLKFSQQDVYTSLCSDYGVVCGRISVNNGLGIPNARVSIFVPLKDIHANDPVISALYPYTSISDKDSNNYRYNLLPSRQQHSGHSPTGTFPDQEDILTREEILEVYETYYTYTVKTNNAGDFMIWGVPLGQQTIHVDVDLSDIGCFSLRPYDFIRQGDGVDKFKNKYSYKSSEDLNSLPQIVSFDKNIEVYPFWGNNDLCEIGITRTDFDLSDKGVKIQPKAFLMGGVFTDTHKNAVNKNCTPRVKMGRKCDLAAKSAKIEALRYTPQKDVNHRPIIEEVDLHEDVPDDGSFVFPLDMNMDYLFTNEFGENEITNDPNKGVPTSACYRLRINMNDNGLDRARANADFLIPNIREYSSDIDKSYAWSLNWDDYPSLAVSNDSTRGMLYSENGEYYPKDYFYRFNYNKIYTVSSFHSHFVSSDFTGRIGYANINEAHPSEEEDCGDKLTPPTNFGKKNFTFTLLISTVLMFIEQLINLVVLTFLNTAAKVSHSLGDSLNFWPINAVGRALIRLSYNISNSGQKHLYLINYPECEECTGGNTLGTQGNQGTSITCDIGTVTVTGSDNAYDRILVASGFTFPILNGDCSGYTTNVTDFLTNQSNYSLVDSAYSIYVNLQSDSFVDTGSGYTFNDITNSFSLIQTYDIQIVETISISGNTTTLETGCDLYDVPYDQGIIKYYFVGTGRTISYTYTTGVTGTLISDTDKYKLINNYEGDVFSPITPSGYCEFMNGVFYVIPGTLSNGRLFDILSEYYRRKLVGKLFCGGIVNYGFIDNWLSGSLYFPQLKVKRMTQAISSKSEGIAKYCRSFARLVVGQGRLYYRSAPFNGSSFATTNFNRPTTFVDLGPRDEFIKEICIDPTLDPNCSVARSIGATSYHDLGELLGLAINYRMEIAGKDGNIDLFFQNNGFSNSSRNLNQALDGDILQLLSINNETGIEPFDLQNPRYIGYQFKYLDPIYKADFFKINGDYGPLPVTLELNEDGYRIRTCLNEGTHLDFSGNTVQGRLTESSQPVPFFLWDKKGEGFGTSGGDKSNQSWDYGSVQLQPLQGMTYAYNITGIPNNDSDQYVLLPMTNNNSGLTISNLNLTDQVEFERISNNDKSSLEDEEYPGFTYLWVTGGTVNGVTAHPPHAHDINATGILYIRVGPVGYNSPDGLAVNGWQTIQWNTNFDIILPERYDYYSGNKQILSTPFQFYFGLIAGKTGLDKFIDLFGPKGAFPPIN
jgi:hypothetical protein